MLGTLWLVSEPRRLSLFIMGWVLQGSTLFREWPHGATGAVGGESFWSVRVRGPDSGASCYVPTRRAELYQTQGKAASKANPILTASATLTPEIAGAGSRDRRLVRPEECDDDEVFSPLVLCLRRLQAAVPGWGRH